MPCTRLCSFAAQTCSHANTSHAKQASTRESDMAAFDATNAIERDGSCVFVRGPNEIQERRESYHTRKRIVVHGDCATSVTGEPKVHPRHRHRHLRPWQLTEGTESNDLSLSLSSSVSVGARENELEEQQENPRPVPPKRPKARTHPGGGAATVGPGHAADDSHTNVTPEQCRHNHPLRLRSLPPAFHPSHSTAPRRLHLHIHVGEPLDNASHGAEAVPRLALQFGERHV